MKIANRDIDMDEYLPKKLYNGAVRNYRTWDLILKTHHQFQIKIGCPLIIRSILERIFQHVQQQLEPVLALSKKPLGGFNWQLSIELI